VQKCIELTVTNSPFGLTIKFTLDTESVATKRCPINILFGSWLLVVGSWLKNQQPATNNHEPTTKLWVIIAWGSHPFPSRTRKLSPTAPMVLHARVCGRVGSCPIKKKAPAGENRIRGFFRCGIYDPGRKVQMPLGGAVASEKTLYYLSLFLVLAAVIAPLWIVDYPGMVDYPNHLVRCYILANYQTNPIWQQRYSLDYTPIPNLAIDLIVVPLAHWLPLIACGKIFLTLAAIFYVIGCSELGRAVIGRPNWLALFASFTFYNSALLYGFVNYVFGLGVFLCAFAFWLQSRHKMSAARFLLCGLLAIVAYLSHLSSIVCLGVACTTVAFLDFRRDHKSLRLILNLAWLVCPVLLMAAFMRGSGSVGRIEWSTIREKAIYLLSPIRSYDLILDVAVLTILVVCGLVIAKRSKVHPVANAALVMAVLFLVTPKGVLTASAVDARYVVPAVVLALLSIETCWGRSQKAALAIAVLVMGIRTASIAANWLVIDQRSRQVLQMGSVLSQGARVYVIQPPVGPEISRKLDRGFVHVIEFWTVSHRAYLSSLFAIAGQQPLVFRKPVCPGPDWVQCLSAYDYVWAYDPPPATKQELVRVAAPAAAWENVTLWRLRP
jgi:hypothetical protein